MVERSRHTVSEPIRSLAINGFLLAERMQPPNWTLPSHSHESTMIGVGLEGSYTEIIDRRSEECVPNTLQILPAGERHSIKFAHANVRCLTIEIEQQRMERIRPFSELLDHPVHVHQSPLAALVVQLYDEFRMRDSTTVLTLEGLILEMIGKATREIHPRLCSAPPLWLRQARDIIHASATDSVSLVDVATSVGVHPTQLARLFRRFYSCSVNQYVRRVRVEYSIRALIESDKSLAEIASAAGFYDQSHFTRIFKLHPRLTPAEFRTKLRASNAHTKNLRLSNT
jgi:AraC family transcriptional regulator